MNCALCNLHMRVNPYCNTIFYCDKCSLTIWSEESTYRYIRGSYFGKNIAYIKSLHKLKGFW